MKTLNTIRRLIPLLQALTLSVLLLVSCNPDTGNGTAEIKNRHELDSLRRFYRNCNVNGMYDSIIVMARPNLHKAMAAHDTLAVLYAGVYTAQAFLTLEEMDSVRRYMNLIAPFRAGGHTDPSLQTVLHAVDGLLHLKTELNYTLAMESFRRGCEWADEGNDPNNHIVLLANMAHIFYIRQDQHGLDYALKAYDISRQQQVAEFPRCQAHLLMGQMLQLAGRTDEAVQYLNTARKMIEEGGFRSLESIYNLIYANVFRSRNNHAEAERCFNDAIVWSSYAEIGTATATYLYYGQFCQEHGAYDRALELYKTGLALSYAHRSMEFRSDLLSHISDIYRHTGNRASAAEYSYLYKSYTDSIANIQKEQEFNSRLMYYSRIEHEHEMQAKELAILQTKRKSTLVTFISAIVVIVALSLYILYMRQRKMNRTLVLQYENYLQRTRRAPDPAEASDTKEKRNQGEQALFQRIEELMRRDRIYRQKDLSLDKLSEMLSTNRAYVSKAINVCASQSFFSYIDQYRIREAVSILSGESGEGATIPFKQVADMVGYNSVQVFYRSFKRETGCSPGQYQEEARRIIRQRNSTGC